jgi:trehalose 6-phosphate synthase
MPWTPERLIETTKTRLQGARLIVVANREPYIHIYDGDEIRCIKPASGLATALDPVMRACGGVWVAHGSGDADRDVADEIGRISVPPESPAYTLRRVWLSKEEEQGYYYGFANEALWPLCHVVYTRPVFDPNHWEQYRRVNQKFAEAVLEEVGDQAGIVFVQDYHFALLPRMLKEARPNLVVMQFWHIPWPNREVMRICPWQLELLDGLLGNDLLAFHIQYHCNNFLDNVDRAIEAKVDTERFAVSRNGHTTCIQPHPISIDPDFGTSLAKRDAQNMDRELRKKLRVGDRLLLIGVDRVDYTKGIPERFHAVDRLLTLHPEWKGRFHFVQVAPPSRIHIRAYRQLNDELETLVEDINWRHGSPLWRPLLFINEHFNAEQVYALYRIAAACVVSSLHDGMNLVAKEFCAARTDHRGVLVLSRFTGAARELTDALLVNPYDADELAEAMFQALTMSSEEQTRRMERMRRHVIDQNIYRWAGTLLSKAAALLDAKQ